MTVDREYDDEDGFFLGPVVEPENESQEVLQAFMQYVAPNACASRKERPWCVSWPCDCGPYSVLNQQCDWDQSTWIDPAEMHVFANWRMRELLHPELGARVVEHLEIGPMREDRQRWETMDAVLQLLRASPESGPSGWTGHMPARQVVSSTSGRFGCAWSTRTALAGGSASSARSSSGTNRTSSRNLALQRSRWPS